MLIACQGIFYDILIHTCIHLEKGVWMSFGVFNVCRLAGVWIHQTKNGPLSERELAKV